MTYLPRPANNGILFTFYDVWDYSFNARELDGWVYVRDLYNDLVFVGWVRAFSDTSKEAELLLEDVSVYTNSTAQRLYQMGVVYLARQRENIIIEWPNMPVSKDLTWSYKENDKK